MTSIRSAMENPGKPSGTRKADSPLAPGRLAGAREHDVEIGDAAVGDPGLLAVENVAVAELPRCQFDIGDVGARLRLGEREGGDGVAAARAFEPVALFGIAEQADRPGTQALHGEGEIGQPIVARQRLAHQTQRAHIERRGRVRIGRGVRQQAIAAKSRHEIAAGDVHIGVVDRQVCRAPALDVFRQRAMALFKERPREEGSVRH